MSAPRIAPASASAGTEAPRAAGAAGAQAAPVETATVGRTARRWLFWIVAVLAVVVFAIVTTLATSSAAPDTDVFSIENAGPDGSRAVAEVLRQQGVDVVAASTLDDAQDAAAAATGPVTVLFADPFGYLDDERLDQVADLGDDLVLVEPGSAELDALAPGIATAGAAEDADSVSAGCTLPAAQKAGEISRPNLTYRVLDANASGSAGSAVQTCFRSYDDAYAVIQLPSEGGSTTVLGAGDVLTNDAATAYGNGALALNLLGKNATLVWYLPGFDDVGDGAPATLGELTPDWVTPVLLLLIVTTIAAGIWRGRRFGPVVVENLPVTVRASETLEGRARLYARQGAHARALDSLRIGTLSRLTVQLALPRHATVVEVSRSVAAVTGRHVDEVHDLLVGGMPRSEADLLRYSDALLVLEQQVARATAPG